VGGRHKRFSASVAILALLSACGGGGGGGTGGGGGDPIVIAPPTSSPPATGNGCSLAERQNWVFGQLNEWYLFPESIAANVNPANFTSVQAYIDALVAPARAQSRDRFFTYITSIAEENAFFNSGSSAGLGVRLSTDGAARRVFIAEAFEGAPALAAGIDRGTEILAIGTTSANLRTVDSIIAAEGTGGISAALGPNTSGTTRLLRVRDTNGTVREVSVTKAEFSLTPVSSRYGARIIDDGGKKVGYVNLRTFISTADPALRNAFAQFKAQGITEMVVDFRYNGGGLVSTAELMNNLLLGQRSPADVMSYTVFRPSKSAFNETDFFAPQPQSIASMKIAFIGTGSSASASELVMNAAIPYLKSNTALIGTNTFGKPVGQIALDRAQCDDRLRVVAFATQNADKQGDYYTGLASKFPVTCSAPDDVTRQLGDPQEGSVKAALDFLAGRQCTPISGGGATTQSAGTTGKRELLTPAAPTTAQREVPGLY
jgi:C-terminal processing protease CtpA/Prc